MKIRRIAMKTLRNATLFLLLFLFGCAPRIYIHSQIDPEYNFLIPKRESSDTSLNKPTIFVWRYRDLTLTEKKFRNLLISELVKQNFEIVDIGTVAGVMPQFVLLFQLGEKTSRIDSYLTLPDWRTTTGNIDGITFKATEYGTKDVPYSYDYTVQGIKLFLYDTESFMSGETTPIWEGFIGAGKKDYDKFPEACIRKLLEYYGKDFRGHVRIDIYSK